MTRLRDHVNLECVNVLDQTLSEAIADAGVYDDRVIRALDNTVYAEGATAVLFGNLAPDGCVIKPAAAEPALLQHTGPALVFKNYADMAARIDDPALEATPEHVLVLQSAGPVGAPGMPEWGQLPIPKPLLERGVRDMVRISDARMSGTSYGACVLHVAPESAVGGPLALVRDGDLITLDVAQRRIGLQVDDAELERRRAEWQTPPPHYHRGFGAMYMGHIQQANTGCDFDFLVGREGVPEPEIH